MKKLIALLLALTVVFGLCACGTTANKETTPETTTAPATEGTTGEEAKVMTYAEYAAAELESEVTVECYVQAHQSWWDNKITVYAQDKDGAYFLYELACSEADAAKLTEGTKIRVTGTKTAWEGEVEIVDATFEFVADADTFKAEPKDITELLADEKLIDYQNQLIAVKGATVKAIEYKNGEPGDDIYVTLTVGEKDYSFCVERYLTDPDSDVYKTVGELAEGDKVNVEGFLYWYQGANPHVTKITKVFGSDTFI